MPLEPTRTSWIIVTSGSIVVWKKRCLDSAAINCVLCGRTVLVHSRCVEPLRQKASRYQTSSFRPGNVGPEMVSRLLVQFSVRPVSAFAQTEAQQSRAPSKGQLFTLASPRISWLQDEGSAVIVAEKFICLRSRREAFRISIPIQNAPSLQCNICQQRRARA